MSFLALPLGTQSAVAIALPLRHLQAPRALVEAPFGHFQSHFGQVRPTLRAACE